MDDQRGQQDCLNISDVPKQSEMFQNGLRSRFWNISEHLGALRTSQSRTTQQIRLLYQLHVTGRNSLSLKDWDFEGLETCQSRMQTEANVSTSKVPLKFRDSDIHPELA